MSADLVSRIARLELPAQLRGDAPQDALVEATRAQLSAWAAAADTASGGLDPLQAAVGQLSLLAVWQARETAQLRARTQPGPRAGGTLWPRRTERTGADAAQAGADAELLHIAPKEVVRQVQQALDVSMDRLDVACDRFRAVSDAHELRLENLRKAMDAERSDRDRALASVHTGGAQLALHIEAETRSLRAADQLIEGRLGTLHEHAEQHQGRLDRLRERVHRQREALRQTEARLTELAQAVQLDHIRLQQRLHWLTVGIVATGLAAAAALAYILLRAPVA